eukprot:scpid71055/ scgid28738/ 
MDGHTAVTMLVWSDAWEPTKAVCCVALLEESDIECSLSRVLMPCHGVSTAMDPRHTPSEGHDYSHCRQLLSYPLHKLQQCSTDVASHVQCSCCDANEESDQTAHTMWLPPSRQVYGMATSYSTTSYLHANK